MKPIHVFTVCHGSIRTKIRILPTVQDVHRAYKARPNKASTRRGRVIHAFFAPTASATAKHVGCITLPLEGGCLQELVPHETTHAVIHAHGGVLPHDDEDCATAVGLICARIFKRLKKIGVPA